MIFYTKQIQNILNDKPSENLFSFSLLFISVYNFVRHIPASGRFKTVFYLFGLAYMIMFFFRYKKTRLSLLTIIGLMPMILGIAINLRVGSDVTNFWLFAPLPLMILGEPVSILDFFK